MPAGGVEVGGGRLAGRGGGEVGQEQRALLAAGQVPGQQPGGPGLPTDELGPAALADDHVPAAGQVQVVDVEGEDLAGPGGALIQQPPQGLVPGAGAGRVREAGGPEAVSGRR
jgi:hypothetical protein